MKISYRWLAEYLDLEISRQAVKDHARKLTMAGAEVEEITYIEEPSPIYVSEVVSVEQHPNTDNLYVVQTEMDTEKLPTITAAKNIQKGDLVPIVKAPGKLPTGQEIERTKFKGETSAGMLCSKQELGLEEKSAGIWILDEFDLSPGDLLTDELEYNDYVLSFEITSNRPDLLSVIGIGREVSAINNLKLVEPKPLISETVKPAVSINIENPNDTLRYSARALLDVDIGPSPIKIQHRLAKVGQRPKNNVVDATNYVMFELGQPLHPFDLDQVNGEEIQIRLANDGEQITTLDGVSRELTSDNLVIADKEKSIALAGVMGGQNSEVTIQTKNILLEGACFSQPRIRKSSQLLGLSTEASRRFEKGMDSAKAPRAIDRTTQLLTDQGATKTVTKLADSYPKRPEEKKIKLRKARAESVLGIELENEKIERILSELGLAVKVLDEPQSTFEVTQTPARVDLTREIDLIEEIARIHGYNKIPSTSPSSGTIDLSTSKREKTTKSTKRCLTGLGVNEVISPGFSPRIELGNDHQLVYLKNPMGSKRNSLRAELSSNLIQHAERNFTEGIDSINLFEIGNVFSPTENTPEETSSLGILLSGRRYEGIDNQQTYNFWDLKGMIEELLHHLNLNHYNFKPGGPEFLHPTRKATIVLQNDSLGFAGELSPTSKERFDLPSRVYLAELDFDLLVDRSDFTKPYKPIPKYPALKRDLSVVVPDSIQEKEIRSIFLSQPYVEKVYLYDRYEGEQIESGKISLTYEVTFRNIEGTLKDEEVNKIIKEINSKLDQLGITLRE